MAFSPVSFEKIRNLPTHPQRHWLANEVHARPYERLQAPVKASHLALMHQHTTLEDELEHLGALCRQFNVAAPNPEQTHCSIDLDLFRLKWERHTEFSTYTFIHAAPFDHPFLDNAIDRVPQGWLERTPGSVMVALHLAIEPESAPERSLDELGRLFSSNTVAGSEVVGGSAVAWTDYRLHEDGFVRILVRDQGLRTRQAGRLAQRLIEIETYRIFALMGLPLARKFAPAVADLDARVAGVTARLTEIGDLEDERSLLQNLSGIAAEVEHAISATNYRFAATLAYYDLVQRRLSDIREQRIEGLQTFSEFMDRRMAPAIQTCKSVHDNLAALSTRLARASDLLRTRVDITVEGQNRDLLQSMNRRAHLQLRLQETVEGLSVVVLSYYLVGLVGYALKAVKSSGVKLNVELWTGLAIPMVVGLVFLGLRQLKRRVMRQAEQPDLLGNQDKPT